MRFDLQAKNYCENEVKHYTGTDLCYIKIMGKLKQDKKPVLEKIDFF